jgi:hypothetical protein
MIHTARAFDPDAIPLDLQVTFCGISKTFMLDAALIENSPLTFIASVTSLEFSTNLDVNVTCWLTLSPVFPLCSLGFKSLSVAEALSSLTTALSMHSCWV